MIDHTYKVAEIVFTVKTDSCPAWNLVHKAYEPFKIDNAEAHKAWLRLTIHKNDSALEEFQNLDPESLGEHGEEGSIIDFYRFKGGLYRIDLGLEGQQDLARLYCLKGFKEAHLCLSQNISVDSYAINSALMLCFAFSTLECGVMLFHSSVIIKDGFGYMFLGKSGTGKSTHSRLWLKHIEGCSLLNDDNPAVKVDENGARVYGTPWSGKTPCYKNESAPLRGITRLSQAPYNKVTPLTGLQAYVAVMPSISNLKWEKVYSDALNNSIDRLLPLIKVQHLECLPDEEAAQLCYSSIKA